MSGRTPLYPRLLRLRHIRPNAWQRAALGEGALAAAAVLVLADLATAWSLLVLPLAVALVVKCHDLVAGALAGARGASTGPAGAPTDVAGAAPGALPEGGAESSPLSERVTGESEPDLPVERRDPQDA